MNLLRQHSKRQNVKHIVHDAHDQIAPSVTLKWVGALALFCVVISSPSCFAKAKKIDPKMKIAVKAAYLYNITKYVTWPKTAFADSKAPYVIGVMGDEKLAKGLKKIVEGKQVKKRSLEIKTIEAKEDDSHVESMKKCHTVFVGKESKEFAEKLKEQLKDTSVLTVSDIPDFCEKDGLMELKLKKGRLKLRVNLEETKVSNLKVSAKLLRQVEIVP